jgi:hypothetical protein
MYTNKLNNSEKETIGSQILTIHMSREKLDCLGTPPRYELINEAARHYVENDPDCDLGDMYEYKGCRILSENVQHFNGPMATTFCVT